MAAANAGDAAASVSTALMNSARLSSAITTPVVFWSIRQMRAFSTHATSGLYAASKAPRGSGRVKMPSALARASGVGCFFTCPTRTDITTRSPPSSILG